MIRPVTENLVASMILDVWPRPAAQTDFGIVSQKHYEALSYPVLSGELNEEQLDSVLGDGQAITTLVNSCKSNPHKGIKFVTPWDILKEEMEEEGLFA